MLSVQSHNLINLCLWGIPSPRGAYIGKGVVAWAMQTRIADG